MTLGPGLENDRCVFIPLSEMRTKRRVVSAEKDASVKKQKGFGGLVRKLARQRYTEATAALEQPQALVQRFLHSYSSLLVHQPENALVSTVAPLHRSEPPSSIWLTLQHASFPLLESVRAPAGHMTYSTEIWDYFRRTAFRAEKQPQQARQTWRCIDLVDEALGRMGWCAAGDRDLFATLLLHIFFWQTETADLKSVMNIAVQVRHMLLQFSVPPHFSSSWLKFPSALLPDLRSRLLILGGLIYLSEAFNEDTVNCPAAIFLTCAELYQKRYLVAEDFFRQGTQPVCVDQPFMRHLQHEMAAQCFVLNMYPRSFNPYCDACVYGRCVGKCIAFSPIPSLADSFVSESKVSSSSSSSGGEEEEEDQVAAVVVGTLLIPERPSSPEWFGLYGPESYIELFQE